MRRTRRRSPRRTLVALGLGLALGLGAAACGGSPDGNGVATLGGDGAGDQQTGGSGTARKDPQEAALEFAKCMREHGVDMPDPEVDDQLTGFIPGVHAGRPTVQYLEYIISRVTFVGALYLGMIAMLPLIAFVLIGADQNFPFGGTSILIMVGVALTTIKQIDAQMEQRHYEGLLR